MYLFSMFTHEDLLFHYISEMKLLLHVQIQYFVKISTETLIHTSNLLCTRVKPLRQVGAIGNSVSDSYKRLIFMLPEGRAYYSLCFVHPYVRPSTFSCLEHKSKSIQATDFTGGQISQWRTAEPLRFIIMPPPPLRRRGGILFC